MPPATTSKAARPASIYSEGLSSTMKKRASISPSAGGGSSSSASSSSMLHSASRTSFKRDREGSTSASTSSSYNTQANAIPTIHTTSYPLTCSSSSAVAPVAYYHSHASTSSSSQHPQAQSTSQSQTTQVRAAQPQQISSHLSHQGHAASSFNSAPASRMTAGPPQLPPIEPSCSSFSIESSSSTSSASPMKVDAGAVHGNSVGVAGTVTSGVAPVQQAGSNGQAKAKATAQPATGSMMHGTGSIVTKENRLLFEDDYAVEVIEYMQEMEVTTGASADLMDMQPELQWYMRPFLVDFLVEIHQQFRLRPEVLYLSLNIVDRYVSKRVVYKKHYQLVGCAALWIASKFEDAKDRVPTVRELADMCCKAYDETAFIQMEGHVLQTIGWTIGHPTAEAWLRLACMGNVREDTKTQHVARFVMEITLFHREFVGCKPSSVAAAALMLARFICGLPRKPSAGDSDEIMRIIQCLDVCFHDHLADISQIVVDKYAPIYYSRASNVVRDWYSSGKQYVYLVMPTPISPASSSGMITPGLVPSWSSSKGGSRYGSSPNGGPFSASSSEAGDDMPRTPITPVGYNAASDPFLVAANAAGVTSAHVQSFREIKENVAPQVAGYAPYTGQTHAHGSVAEVGTKKHVPHAGSVFNATGGPTVAVAQPQRMALHPVQPNAIVGTAPAFPRALRRLSN